MSLPLLKKVDFINSEYLLILLKYELINLIQRKKAEIVTNIRGEFQTIGAFQKPQIYLRLLIRLQTCFI